MGDSSAALNPPIRHAVAAEELPLGFNGVIEPALVQEGVGEGENKKSSILD